MSDSHKILIVDDSKLFRRVISKIFESAENFVVAGEAENGKEAVALVPELDPDVVILDINMPVMDGLTALKHIMIKSPKPTVMFSTLTQAGATVTFDALKCGAVDFIHKPSKLAGIDLDEQRKDILRKVNMAASVAVDSLRYLKAPPKNGAEPPVGAPCEKVYAMGAAEGGYTTLLKIIPRLDPKVPAAYMVVLYEPEAHVTAFARYLSEHSACRVKVAEDGEPLSAGTCYLSAGTRYMTLEAENGRPALSVSTSPFPGRRGTTNMLMFSAAEVMKDRTVGVVLSGAGHDGAEGLGEILRVGGTALVQNPAAALCDEMPANVTQRVPQAALLTDGALAIRG